MSTLLLLGASSAGAMVTPASPVDPSADVAAIQAAIDAANTAGGGMVVLKGSFTINAPITMKPNVHLTGIAPWGGRGSSVIHLASGSNCHMITTNNAVINQFMTISDLALDGHMETNPSGGNGINIQGPYGQDEFANCNLNLYQRVLIQYCKGHGFSGVGVEDRLDQVYAYNNLGSGIRIPGGTDMWITNCTAGQNAGHGFDLVAANSGHRLIGCKSWWAGRNRTTRGTTALPAGAGTATGFALQGNGHQIVGCQAQDNSGPGLYMIAGQGSIIENLVLDMNGIGMGAGNSVAVNLAQIEHLFARISTGPRTSGRYVTEYALTTNSVVKNCRIEMMCRPEALTNAGLHPGAVNGAGQNNSFVFYS